MWHATDNGLYRTAQGDEDLEAAKIRRCVSISTLYNECTLRHRACLVLSLGQMLIMNAD